MVLMFIEDNQKINDEEKEIEKVNKYYMEENMLNAVKLLQYNENNDFDDIEDTKEL